ncbi:MAG TPA: class I SAM-dependent methyltransferase [Methanothermobacter sp.]|nr:class I SAM-dependent methyltransferase [Methanothermobacter sp.]
MSNNTGLYPSNGHRIRGRTSESFIDARDVISRLNLKGNEVFMDAGCGDGHAAMIAYDMMDAEATIYAVDDYHPSIDDLKKDLEKDGITNVIPIQSDITKKIDLDDDTVDVCLLINVFHHFVATKSTDEAISELKRIIKPDGRIAVMDYKKMDTGYGPPVKFKRSPDEIREMFKKHGLKMVQLDTETGEDLEDGTKSHYLIVFKK